MFDSLKCVNIGGDYNLDGEKNDRPDAMADHIHTTHAQWANGFNLPDHFFSAPCLGCVGNLGRNTFIGPSYWSADISLSKTFALFDRFNLQFRAEAFNVFNHTNFLIGENRLNTPNFGQAGGTAPPRNLQFGLKLSLLNSPLERPIRIRLLRLCLGHGQTGSNSAVHVLERIGGADIANLGRSRAPSAQCFGTRMPASSVLDLCFSLLQVGVDRTSDQFCDRRPCDLGEGLQLGHLARSHEQRCPKHRVLHDIA